MRDPRKKKLRDLRRIARSSHYPSLFKFFGLYHPHLAHLEDDPNCWQFYSNARREWVFRICENGTCGGGSPPSSFRRDQNRLLKAKQKAVFSRALLDDDWDNFHVPRHYKTIGWLWW